MLFSQKFGKESEKSFPGRTNREQLFEIIDHIVNYTILSNIKLPKARFYYCALIFPKWLDFRGTDP